ncbi:MAG: hypothetical protein ACLQK4_14350 [Acidimicrobiales bacterium]|jgi:hypothetical protein
MTTDRIRSRPLQVLAVIWVAASLVPIWICLHALIDGSTTAVDLVASTVLVVNVLIGLLLVRLARTGIDLDAKGVLVRNLLESRRVSWAEISTFVWREKTEDLPGAVPADKPLRIRRLAGPDIVVRGLLFTKSEKSRRTMEALADYLNQRLAAARPGPGEPDWHDE